MLSKKAKYAIKALTYLATREDGKPVKTSEIAEKAVIPKKFLELILLELKSAMLVASRQGMAGGYYLTKKPDQINLADIYRLFDGAVALLPCASIRFYQPCDDCPDENTCMLRKSLIEVKYETLAALKKVTIQSLITGL